ncbi:MAG: hypothetical protein RIT04_14 [Candidatus Parcubacteria bacterium]|jgi:excinuclease UvrABC nuclease subunit
MTSQDFQKLNLPDSPGVYFFKGSRDSGAKNEILYIGRATSLRDRVRSYFGDDLIHTRGPLLIDMVTRANTVEWQETGSVLEAIILEANLIKTHQPYFNTKEKDNRSFNYIVITEEAFPRILMVRGRNLEKMSELKAADLPYVVAEVFGPYPNSTVLRGALKIIRRIFPYRDSCSPCENSSACKPCFNYQIGLCPGMCAGKISEKDYMVTVKRIQLFLRGKTSTLIESLERDMNRYAKVERFEDANDVKKVLYALSHIQDIALINRDGASGASGGASSGEHSGALRGFRIEAYDIAHLGGKDVVGVMTVLTNGIPDKAEYRKFKIRGKTGKKIKAGAEVKIEVETNMPDGKIRTTGNDDVNNLKEILSRRLGRSEWQLPDLIVIDGGIAQKNAAEAIVTAFNMQIPVVSVVKDDSHKAREILGEVESSFHPNILLANTEAHRFAIAYHKLLRKKSFLRGLVK